MKKNTVTFGKKFLPSSGGASMAGLRQTPLTCSGHTRPVVQLYFSKITQNGYYLISACKDGKPMLRKGETGDWIGTFEGHKGAVWGVALNSDVSRAATGAADFTAKIWDAEKGSELFTFTHQHVVKSVDFSKDGNKLLTGSNEKLLRIYDLNKPEAEGVEFAGHTSSIRNALFLEEKKVISAADDKTVRLWDCATAKEIKSLSFDAAPTSLEISADGSVLVITYGKTVSFWRTDNLELIKQHSVPTQVNSASLHPDKNAFVCAGEDFKVYKYNYETGEEIESFKGHFGPIHCIRFSPDGELYASGSEDGTLRLWQTTVGKTYGLWKCVPAEEVALPEVNSAPS